MLDPFCGCGTAVAAAQKLKRQWIGIDITHLAIGLIKRRLKDAFGDCEQPRSDRRAGRLAGAEARRQEPYQFQWWALGLVGARPLKRKRARTRESTVASTSTRTRGAANQADHFLGEGRAPQAKHVRDLRGVIEREKAEIGVLISMQPPTQPMLKEAAEAGFYQVPDWEINIPDADTKYRRTARRKKVEFPDSRRCDVQARAKIPQSRPKNKCRLALAT